MHSKPRAVKLPYLVILIFALAPHFLVSTIRQVIWPLTLFHFFFLSLFPHEKED